jgi:hypothetical protein
MTRYEVSSAAGKLIAGATPRTVAMSPPKKAIVSIAHTKIIPLLRWSSPPFVE